MESSLISHLKASHRDQDLALKKLNLTSKSLSSQIADFSALTTDFSVLLDSVIAAQPLTYSPSQFTDAGVDRGLTPRTGSTHTSYGEQILTSVADATTDIIKTLFLFDDTCFVVPQTERLGVNLPVGGTFAFMDPSTTFTVNSVRGMGASNSMEFLLDVVNISTGSSFRLSPQWYTRESGQALSESATDGLMNNSTYVINNVNAPVWRWRLTEADIAIIEGRWPTLGGCHSPYSLELTVRVTRADNPELPDTVTMQYSTSILHHVK
jgi:hypothetical protein